VYNRKPVIDLGTLGIKANVQVVVPFLTESYYSTDDPLELSVPLDTICNFPYRIEHMIQWAHNNFLELFKEIPEQAQKYMLDSKVFIEEISKDHLPSYIDSKIDNIKQILGENRPKTFADCIKWVIHHCLFCMKSYFM
jgi:ubiquitin-activating enzyme E1